MSGVFISYRREDSSYIAGRLHDRLAAALGPERIFRDVDAMKPGVDFTERIGDAVGSCEALLAIIGNDWLSARSAHGGRRIDEPEDWVRLEIAAALTRGILVVPVLVENARMPTEAELPDDLRPLARRNAMDLTDRRWREDTENLLEIVREAMPSEPETAPAVAPPPAADVPARVTPRRPPAVLRRLAGLPAGAKVASGLLAAVLVVFLVASLLTSGEEPADETGSATALSYPQGLALDGAGNLFVADPGRDDVLRIALGTGTVAPVRAEPAPGPEDQVTPTPWAVASAGGTLYVAGEEEGGILRIGPDGVVTRVVARAAGSDLKGATAIAVDGEGRLVAATDREVLRIGPDGSLAPVAGGPTKGFGGDGGPATAAKLDSPTALAYGPDGSLYIADSGNRRVRRVDTTGVITTVAGTGKETPGGDGGPAVEAGLGTVSGLAVDRDGNVYLAAEYQVRRIDPNGTINRFAGHPEYESGLSGDGGPALAAVLSDVTALAVDSDRNLYIADAGNERIRRIDAAGVITTVV